MGMDLGLDRQAVLVEEDDVLWAGSSVTQHREGTR